MKVKKLLSLALAGVMAAGMLAGCKGGAVSGGANGAGSESGNMAQKVIDAMDEETKELVAFAYSPELKNDLDIAMRNAGSGALSNDKDAQAAATDITLSLMEIDPDYEAVNVTGDITGEDVAKEEAKLTIAMPISQLMFEYGSDEAFVVDTLAKAADVMFETMNDSNVLPAYSKDFEDDGTVYWYDFDYSADLAITSVTDVVTGQVTYVMGISITRTPTKVVK